MMTAWTWNEDFHLTEKFDDILDSLEDKNFGNLQSSVILQCAGAIIEKTTKKKSILELNSNEVRDSINILKQSLEKAIDYLSTQFNCISGDFLPRVQQIIALCYLFSQVNSLNIQQTKCLNKWFWRTSFSNRYSASTDKKMDDDILFIDNLINKNYSALKKYNSEVSIAILSKLKFSKSNSLVKAFILLMAQYQPKDLITNSNIDTGKALSVYNRKEYHHIFPKNFLQDKGYHINNINLAMNFCFLSSSSNKIIRNKAPSNYFFNEIDSDEIFSILNSNLIPNNNLDLYRNNNYEEFITERAKLILEKISNLTGENL